METDRRHANTDKTRGGIYKRKQESKKTRKQEHDLESDQEKKESFFSFFLGRFLGLERVFYLFSWPLSFFLFFFFWPSSFFSFFLDRFLDRERVFLLFWFLLYILTSSVCYCYCCLNILWENRGRHFACTLFSVTILEFSAIFLSLVTVNGHFLGICVFF